MNNKLYKKYISLKIENSNFFYLFKTKNFYFFISDDAKVIAPKLNLELTQLDPVILKCEFPIEDFEIYNNKLKNLNINFEIISLTNDIFNHDLELCLSSTTSKDTLNTFFNVKIDDLSISQAYELLHNLQKKLKNSWFFLQTTLFCVIIY